MKQPAREVGLRSRNVLDVAVHTATLEEARRQIVLWAARGDSRYVCACNVHMVMEAHDDPAFRGVVNGADLVTPDGMPLVWALRLLGERNAARVYGPDVMLVVCQAAELEGLPVGLYGSTPIVVERLVARLVKQFPRLRIVYARAPTWTATLPPGDDVAEIQTAGARIVFVALGCPKQERWMATHRGRIPGVMIGVGAAFDFIAGTKPQAPRVLRAIGLEWLFRLATEPGRLWRRYAVHNPRFVVLLGRQLLSRRGKR